MVKLRRWLGLGALAVLVGTALVAALLRYADTQLSQWMAPPALTGWHQIQVDVTAPANRPGAIPIASAASNGGAKLDVYYDVQRNDYLIDHTGNTSALRPDDVRLTLSHRLADIHGHFPRYWLDIKQLHTLDQPQMSRAIARLEQIITTLALKSRIYIGSDRPMDLSPFRRQGFQTVLYARELPENDALATLSVRVYKVLYWLGDFSVIALHPHKLSGTAYRRAAHKVWRDLPVFLLSSPRVSIASG